MEAASAIGRRSQGYAENVRERRAGLHRERPFQHRVAATGERGEHLAAAAEAARRAILAALGEAQEIALRRRLRDRLDQLRAERGPVPVGVLVELVEVPRHRGREARPEFREPVQHDAGRSGHAAGKKPAVEGRKVGGEHGSKARTLGRTVVHGSAPVRERHADSLIRPARGAKNVRHPGPRHS